MDKYAHVGLIHKNGEQCIWLDDEKIWFVPLDVGGEGYPCTQEHPSAERYDEDTLMKVAVTIRTNLREVLGNGAEDGFILRKTMEIVGDMQNKGILFRERA